MRSRPGHARSTLQSHPANHEDMPGPDVAIFYAADRFGGLLVDNCRAREFSYAIRAAQSQFNNGTFGRKRPMKNNDWRLIRERTVNRTNNLGVVHDSGRK